MALTATFSSILNEYAPDALFQEEAKERVWLINNVEHDEKWLGGSLTITFQGAQARSGQFANLPSASDISEDSFTKGTIAGPAELRGSMVFNEKDITQHGVLNSQNLLKLLPDKIEDFMDYFSSVASMNMTNGARACKITVSTSAASGIFTVDNVERLTIGQKLSLVDDNTTAVDVYVTAINMSTPSVTLSATRGGAAYDASDFTSAQNARLNHIGAAASGCESLRSMLLSSANGGGASIAGVTKTSWPALQAQQIEGASFTASNVLDKIFDAYVQTRQRGRGKPNKCLMSHLRLGAVLKLLESGKGAYHIDQKSSKVKVYDWDSVTVVAPLGALELVGLQELDNDLMFFLDTRPGVMKIYSNGGIKKRTNPETKNSYFEVRNTTGYQYIVDCGMQFSFNVNRPSYCGVVYGITF